MRLNELLEKHTLKSVSQQTMISEENIQRVVSEDYSGLTRAKALGFLSILSREYDIDIKDVRNNAIAHFDMNHEEEESVNIALPRVEEKKGRSKFFILAILGLLAYASWYFFTQFDKKTLKKFMPAQKQEQNISAQRQDDLNTGIQIDAMKISEETIKKDLAISDKTVESTDEATEPKNTNIVSVVTPVDEQSAFVVAHNTTVVEHNSTPVLEGTPAQDEINKTQIPNTNTSKIEENKRTILTVQNDVAIEANTTTAQVSKEVNATVVTAVVKPLKRLWFGLVNMHTGKRDHFSMRKDYTIDLSKANWLLATSPAPFSLVFNGREHKYNNGKPHYFMIIKEGIVPLSKRDYVRKGGYRKW